MADTPLTLVIDADDLRPQRLSEIMREFMGLVNEIDTELSEGAQRSTDWRIASVSYNSPLTLRLAGNPRAGHRDNSRDIVRACIHGPLAIETGRRPSEFNDAALDHLKQLGVLSRGTSGIRIESEVESQVKPPRITPRTIQDVERVAPLGYAMGSVEGRLEGLNIHADAYCTVWDAITARGVRCYFPAPMLESVRAAVGHIVSVSGNLRRDTEGRPQQMRRVTDVRVLDQPSGGNAANARGAFGRIENPDSYLERVRGE